MEKIPRFEKTYTETPKTTKEHPEQMSSLGRYSEWFREREMLKAFSPEQARVIRERQNLLSSLAYFIGKNFSIKIALGLPSKENPSGWRWGKRKNGEKYIQMNAHDLLEKPMDYLRYVTSHEGGHERVSRTEFISPEEWNQLGFSFMMNAIEDPRMNNFVAETYPSYRQWMHTAHKEHLGFEEKSREAARQTLGFQPRHMQAGFEYIKQWFREEKGEDFHVDEELPDEVKEVIKNTLQSAAHSWKVFPTRQMADGKQADELGLTGESSIVAHARASYEINRDKIWPEFRKLIEADIDDQKIQEAIKDMQDQVEQEEGQDGEGGQPNIPQELKDKLSPKEQKELEDAIKDAIKRSKEAQAEKEQEAQEGGGGGKGAEQKTKEGEEASGQGEGGEGGEEKEGKTSEPIPLDSLSKELKDKIKEYIESLPEEQKEEIRERAERAIKEFDDILNDELQGKLTKNPEQREKEAKSGEEQKGDGAGGLSSKGAYAGDLLLDPLDTEHGRAWRDRLRKELEKDANVYEKYRREVLALIKKTESDLRRILIEQESTWQTGYKSGKRIDIQRRIQEKAKDVSVLDSRAWRKREHPEEREYAFSLLVDLSGSMREKIKDIRKIDETFKSVIVFAEALNHLGINTEVIGFNDELYEYQNFGQAMSGEVRERMSAMFKEVEESCCSGCGNEHSETDLGWATQTAMERLLQQRQDQKMLIVLSDGELSESPKHPREKYDLEKIKKEMLEQTDVVLIDIDTVAGKTVEEITEELKKLIEQKKTD